MSLGGSSDRRRIEDLLVEHCARFTAPLLVLEGGIGIGKSTLLNRVAARAGRRLVLAVPEGSRSVEADRPASPESAEAGARPTLPVFSAHPGISRTEALSRMLQELDPFLGSERHLLVVGDAELLDDRSLDVLEILARDERLGIAICTSRGNTADRFGEALSVPRGRHVVVPALAREDLADLIARESGATPSPSVTEYLLEVSAGNGTAATATMIHGFDEGWLTIVDGRVVFNGVPAYLEPSPALRAETWKIPALSVPARDLLFRLCLLGDLSREETDPDDLSHVLPALEESGLVVWEGPRFRLGCRALRFALQLSIGAWELSHEKRQHVWAGSAGVTHPDRSVFTAFRAGILCTADELVDGARACAGRGLLSRAEILLDAVPRDDADTQIERVGVELQSGRPKHALAILAALGPDEPDALRFSAYIHLVALQEPGPLPAILDRLSAMAGPSSEEDVVLTALRMLLLWHDRGAAAVVERYGGRETPVPDPRLQAHRVAHLHVLALRALAHASLGDTVPAARALDAFRSAASTDVPAYAQEWLRMATRFAQFCIGEPREAMEVVDWFFPADERMVPGLCARQMMELMGGYLRGAPDALLREQMADAYVQLHTEIPLRRRVRPVLEMLGLLVGESEYGGLTDTHFHGVHYLAPSELDRATARLLPLAEVLEASPAELTRVLSAPTAGTLLPAVRAVILRRADDLTDATLARLGDLLTRSPFDASVVRLIRSWETGDQAGRTEAIEALSRPGSFVHQAALDRLIARTGAVLPGHTPAATAPATGSSHPAAPHDASLLATPERVGRTRRNRSSGLRRPVDRLSDREHEIAVLVCDGLSNTAIAQTLRISRRTVEAHVRNVYRKLGVHSRQELWAEMRT
ncbi:helix-turn-helix transcriptional regulator [Microbacterium resistens]|uniref:helix-turn-helix transcriptional regulator n=1 Tax=Microbacterium resistens TaxID=156977 RepID=UPI000829A636|nr:helix-turn-helix transcriptional regulator [Microbacterium resistens]